MPPSTEPILTKVDDLVHRVATRLDQLGCHVRNFWISTYEGGLILQGRVPSHHNKQMAQRIAMEVTGLLIVTNEIEVD